MIIEELCSLVRGMTIMLKMSVLSLHNKSSVSRSQIVPLGEDDVSVLGRHVCLWVALQCKQHWSFEHHAREPSGVK